MVVLEGSYIHVCGKLTLEQTQCGPKLNGSLSEFLPCETHRPAECTAQTDELYPLPGILLYSIATRVASTSGQRGRYIISQPSYFALIYSSVTGLIKTGTEHKIRILRV